MKKLGLSMALLLAVLSFKAQENNIEERSTREVQTLFGNKSGFGGYLGLNTKLGEVNGHDALFTGGELAFVFNRSFNFGVEGYGMVNHVRSNDFTIDDEQLFIQMGYGGFHLEPVIWSENIIHITAPVLLGAGGVGQTVRPYWEEVDGEVTVDFEHRFEDSDYFFVAEPGVDVELNLFKFMRLAGGMSYRFTSEIEVGSLTAEDIGGWNANLSLRIGWF